MSASRSAVIRLAFVYVQSLTIQWEKLPRRERERLDRKQRLINSRFRVTEQARQENSLPVYRYSAASTTSGISLVGDIDSSIDGGDGSGRTQNTLNTGRAVHQSMALHIDNGDSNLIEVKPASDLAHSREWRGLTVANTAMGGRGCVGLGGGRGFDRRVCESGDSAPLVVLGNSAVVDVVTREGRDNINQR